VPRDCQQKHKVGYLHTKPHEQAQKHVCLHTPKNIQRQKKVQSCFFEFKATKMQRCGNDKCIHKTRV
jgi:hypothetical protein